MTHAKLFGIVAAALALLATAAACSDMSSADLASSGPSRDGKKEFDPEASGSSSGGSVGNAPGADLAPVSNGVILVHAASTSSFRLCFKNFVQNKPTPEAALMPEANVVGVERGAAARIPPIKGSPGEVFLYDEQLIRHLYVNGGGPTCETLITTGTASTSIGRVDEDLSTGVHLLIVTGCPKNDPLQTFSKAQCGDDWTDTKGNLHAKVVSLAPSTRRDKKILPAQVLHLSRDLESARGGRVLKVTFGDLLTGNHKSSATPEINGAPVPIVEPPTIDDSNPGVYKDLGFRVVVENGGTSGQTIYAQQSMADVQLLSAPREVPSTYYSVGSNYVFLLLGETAPKYYDGGADPDPNRNIHLLAVPVIDPADEDAGVAPPLSPPDGG